MRPRQVNLKLLFVLLSFFVYLIFAFRYCDLLFCYCDTVDGFMDGFGRPQSHNSMASTVVVICVIIVWCLMVFWTGGSPQTRNQCKGVKGAKAGCRGGGAGRRCTSVD